MSRLLKFWLSMELQFCALIIVIGVSFADDDLMGLRYIDCRHGFYGNAELEKRHSYPRQVNAKRIGYFGFFRPQFRDTLWQQALQGRTATLVSTPARPINS